MKQSFLAIVALMFLFSSCKKTMSGDEPLDKGTVQAVYVSTENNNIISYHSGTGVKRWEAIMKGSSEGTPVILGQTLYTLTSNGYLYAIDIITGKILREKNLFLAQVPLLNTQPSLAINNNKIYVASDKLYCYDTVGNELWNYNPGVPFTTSPTIVNNRIYVGVVKLIVCVDATSGNLVWQSIPIVELDPADIITSSPRVSNGLVYFGADNKTVYALKASDGSIKWEYHTTDKVRSSPMVYGGMCVVGCQDFGIHCIDTTTGLKRWIYPTAERVYSSPTIHELTNTVLVGSYDFNLYAIDHVSGQLKWKYPAASLIKSSPVVYGNYVYFHSFDRYIYCVDVRDGSLIWKQFMNGSSESSPLIHDGTNATSPSISGMSKY